MHILLVRRDNKRYVFYRFAKYRTLWGVTNYNGIFKDNEPKKGLSNGSIYENEQQAKHKFESLIVQAKNRDFVEVEITSRNISKYFPDYQDISILEGKKKSKSINNMDSKKIINSDLDQQIVKKK